MAVAFFILAAAAAPPPAKGADILVTSTAGGSTTIDGNCTLWEAIAAAKGNSAVDACAAGEEGAPDVVNVPAGTFSWDFSMAILGGAGGPLVVRGSPPTIFLHPTVVQIVTKSPLRFLRLIEGADVTLENLRILGGDVTGDPTNEKGGTILVDEVAQVSLTISNVEIADSRAQLGGAIYFSTQGGGSGPRRLRIQGTRFFGNVADFGLDPGSPRGGAVYLELHDATEARIAGSSFSVNRAHTFAQDWDVYGGALFADLRDQSSLVVTRSSFGGNWAEAAATGSGHPRNGGATIVAADDSSVRLSDVSFLYDYLLGQIEFEAPSSLAIASGMSSAIVLDRIYLRKTYTKAESYRVFLYQHLSSIPARLSNIVAFSEGSGGGAVVEAFASEVVLTNWTAAHSGGPTLMLKCHPGGDVRLLNSLMNFPGGNTGCSPVDPSTRVLFDPHFNNLPAGDLRLRHDSPMIDLGVDEFVENLPFDADHLMRIAGAHVDVGAYEFGSTFGDDFESGDTSYWSSTSP